MRMRSTKMFMDIPMCFECNRPAEHRHHVVPRSKGGTKTVGLCHICHAKIHSQHLLTTSKLTRDAMRRKRDKGERVGQIPYGFILAADGVSLVQCDREQAVIQTIHSLRGKGLSLRAIAAELESAGVAAKQASKWNAMTIRRILNRTA